MLIATYKRGSVPQNQPRYGKLQGTFTATYTGPHTIEIYNYRNLNITDLWNYIDDISVAPVDPDFHVDPQKLSIASSGTVTLTLDAGAAYAGKRYLVLASLGTHPGLTVSGLHVPLNPDYAFSYSRNNINSSVFINSSGLLNGAGMATSTFRTPGPVNPTLLGRQIYFAYVLMDSASLPIVYASNPVMVNFIQ